MSLSAHDIRLEIERLQFQLESGSLSPDEIESVVKELGILYSLLRPEAVK